MVAKTFGIKHIFGASATVVVISFKNYIADSGDY